MSEKKCFLNKKLYCATVGFFLIFSGCSTNSKNDQLLSLQRQRIIKLERELNKKNSLISDLKAEKWAGKPVKKAESVALRPLKKQMIKKNWAQALKLSGSLKKAYPNSMKLAKYRYIIFKNMGLKKQAAQEMKEVRQMAAKNKTSKVR